MASSSNRDRHGGSWDKRKRPSRAAEDAAAPERSIEIELADLRMLAASQQEQIDHLHAPIDSNVSGIFNMREHAAAPPEPAVRHHIALVS